VSPVSLYHLSLCVTGHSVPSVTWCRLSLRVACHSVLSVTLCHLSPCITCHFVSPVTLCHLGALDFILTEFVLLALLVGSFIVYILISSRICLCCHMSLYSAAQSSVVGHIALTHSLTHSLSHSLTHSLTHSLPHSLNQSLTHIALLVIIFV